MHPNLPSTHLGQTPEMTSAGMVYNGKCATDQAQRRGVKRSAGPYTGLFYPHLRATSTGDAGGVSFEHSCTPVCPPLTWAKHQR